MRCTPSSPSRAGDFGKPGCVLCISLTSQRYIQYDVLERHSLFQCAPAVPLVHFSVSAVRLSGNVTGSLLARSFWSLMAYSNKPWRPGLRRVAVLFLTTWMQAFIDNDSILRALLPSRQVRHRDTHDFLQPCSTGDQPKDPIRLAALHLVAVQNTILAETMGWLALAS